MAEEWLEEIYAHAGYITKLKDMVRICQVGNSFDAIYRWKQSCDHLVHVAKECPCADRKVIEGIVKIFRMTPQTNNCEKMIDLIQLHVLPVMYYLVSRYGKIDAQEGGIRFLSSKAGYLTIYDEESKRYRYSACDPMEEAYEMACSFYDPRNTEYHIWGGGLGYVAYQIYSLSRESAKIHVYESDEYMLDYGRRYGVLDWIAEEKLILHRDPRGAEFMERIDEKRRNYYIAKPDMYYRQGEGYILFQRFYYNQRYWIEEKDLFQINLGKNLKYKDQLWNLIPREGYEKSIIVAGGPSLEQDLEYLRKEDARIIAVGTVYRRLLREGITPDLVAFIEGNKIVYEQIEGLEEEKIPLLLAPFVYWRIAENYKGPVYFAQVDTDLECGEFSGEDPGQQFQIGGTVAFFAMEAAIHLGAREIHLVGLDLAFPTETTHAGGTARNTRVNIETIVEVAGVNGGTVNTDGAFDLYRRQIEELISCFPDIEFINHSMIGAQIKGTRRTR